MTETEVMCKICEMVYDEEQKRTLLAKGRHKGLNYYVLSLGTHPCAYVDYGHYLINEDDIECHGGVTYHQNYLRLPLPYDMIGGNFIGWDYVHYEDFVCYPNLHWTGRKYTTDELIAECINVIDQIMEGETND